MPYEPLAHRLAIEAHEAARGAGAPWALCRAAIAMAGSAGDDAAARASMREALELSAPMAVRDALVAA